MEVKCVYQNIEPTSQAKADKIVADSIFSLQLVSIIKNLH